MIENKIDGIKCEVSNCEYHDGATSCLAGQIQVGPHAVNRTNETCCDTFRCKDCHSK